MDPHASGLVDKNTYSSKRKIESSVVAVLHLKMEGRGLNLIKPISRALKKNEIHELIITDEEEAKPGSIVNQVSYLAFIEISQGGVIVVGDEVYWNNNLLGTVAGFDDTHMPNHQNIVLYSPIRRTGEELSINIEDHIIIQSKKESD
ncbi:MAG: hypothetical protein XE03_1766 [candidate division TA06 bacterium 34_109]|uniref:DUF6917 domain-containing protein n=1 Tax=candidate division TA06 bacterium 34_109 TaxID=1635277 RepID=A0A117M5V9_UNCT6|nr:MAG: hypothetical protein XE03_1766 [candidate division TA06 bacterium 34_109]